jgi:hypothetical protein
MAKPSPLYCRSGITPHPLGFLAERSQRDPPSLSWVEPRPGLRPDGSRGAISNWKLLYGGTPPLELPITEARLFWPARALHLLCAPDGARWLEYREAPPEGAAEAAEWAPVPVQRAKRYRVKLRQDRDRFQFQRPAQLEDVVIVEYRVGGSVAQWRIEPGIAAPAEITKHIESEETPPCQVA